MVGRWLTGSHRPPSGFSARGASAMGSDGGCREINVSIDLVFARLGNEYTMEIHEPACDRQLVRYHLDDIGERHMHRPGNVLQSIVGPDEIGRVLDQGAGVGER